MTSSNVVNVRGAIVAVNGEYPERTVVLEQDRDRRRASAELIRRLD